MAIYLYKGIKKTGEEVKDKISADNVISAKQKLKSMGIMLMNIKEEKSSASTKKRKTSLSFGSKVSTEDRALMTRQLATLVKAQIQIVEALSALVDQVENNDLRVILSEIKQKVSEGSSLAKALEEYPKIFDNVYVNMVDAGEASGTLEIVLLRLADFQEAQLKLRNRIKSAMFYPVLMTVFGGAMMIIIFTTVIPKIARIFISMKKELPLQTKICIAMSDFLINYWYLCIIFGVGFIYIFKKYIHSTNGERRWHNSLLKAPIVGEISTMINVSRFTSTLATLLNSGVPILTSMKIVINLIENVHIKSALKESRDNISEGASLAAPLKKSGYFPAMVTHMITLGERSGELEPMLNIIAENYENQVDAKLNGLTAVLEPIMMIFMGLGVGFVVLSVIGPMMDMTSFK